MENQEFYQQTTLPHFQVSTVQEKETIPEQIGPYHIDSVLSKGGMSILYLGNHPDTNTPLAIKVLSPQLSSHKEIAEQFLKEAEIIRLADHPNIVRLFGQGEWEKGLYIAMEFIQGISLKQFIVQQSLSLKRCIDIILQGAYAILHLHTHGVIHRDLKPENMLITESGQIKVIDFGIAQLALQKKENPFKQYGQMIGTPSYMSPEQKKDPLHVNFNTDIYSLGVVAYEIIMGKLSMGNIQLSFLPKNIRKIIEKMLLSDPNERYQDIVDVITDLSDYLKSSAFHKDRSGEDDKKEFWEQIEKVQKKFNALAPPKWADLEIGVGKSQNELSPGLYYDFIKLPDNSQVALIAYEDNDEMQSTVHLASFRGMFRALLDVHIYQDQIHNFDTPSFIAHLNNILARDEMQMPLHFTFIHFYPPTNEFAFVSSERNAVWHLSSTRKSPTSLHSQSSQIGVETNVDFNATKDNWQVGDHLMIHTFLPPNVKPDIEEKFNQLLSESIIKTQNLSANAKAESLFQTLAASDAGMQSDRKVILTFQRID